MKRRVQWLALSMCIALYAPLYAHAAAYKCKQPNGSMSFQDTPCTKDAVGSSIALPKVQGDEPVDAGSVKNQKLPGSGGAAPSAESDFQKRRAEKEVKEHNEQAEASNRLAKCQRARQQLDVLKAQRPAYRVDANGQRNYINDDNRAAEIAAGDQRAAEACN
jgi:hypothetical protein